MQYDQSNPSGSYWPVGYSTAGAQGLLMQRFITTGHLSINRLISNLIQCLVFLLRIVGRLCLLLVTLVCISASCGDSRGPKEVDKVTSPQMRQGYPDDSSMSQLARPM